jgi:hypothetical protein
MKEGHTIAELNTLSAFGTMKFQKGVIFSTLSKKEYATPKECTPNPPEQSEEGFALGGGLLKLRKGEDSFVL